MARARLRESLVVFLLTLGPASAAAQTPFSNVSPTGARVGPVDDGLEPFRIGIRIDGGYSSSPMPVRATATDDTTRMRAETRRTAVMAGSVSIRRMEAFLSSIAWDSQVGSGGGAVSANESTVREGRIYKQWGDVAAGVRVNGIPIGSSLRMSVEGGAQFYGKNANANSDKKDGCCPGISGDATSLFSRARFGWDTGAPLTAFAMAGVLYDRTSYIWEELKTDLSRADAEPYPEERRAFGIYGNAGMLRILGGAGVSYEISKVVGVFGETSFELNETEPALRLTPGVRVTPLSGQTAAFLLYFDVNPLGTTRKLSPAEPPLRVNVGMAYTFGDVPARRGERGTGGGTFGRTPDKSRDFVVSVEDAKGAALGDTVLQVMDARRNLSEEQRTDNKGQAPFDGKKFGTSPVQVKVLSTRSGYQAPPYPIELDPQKGPGRIVLHATDSLATELRLTFVDSSGITFTQPLRVSLTPSAAPGYRGYRVTVPAGTLAAPLKNPAGEWRVDVEYDGASGKQTATKMLRIVAGKNVDTVELGFALPASVAASSTPAPTPRPTETARVSSEPQPQEFLNVFEADLAQVRPAEVKRVAIALKNGGKKLSVLVKGGGDPLFVQTLLRARCEALSAALKSEATGGPVPECKAVIGAADKVVVE